MWRVGSGRALRWNTSLIIGLDSNSPDSAANLNIEYEF
jgi:hypothetical protein